MFFLETIFSFYPKQFLNNIKTKITYTYFPLLYFGTFLRFGNFSQNLAFGGWSGSSVVKSTCCSSREHEFLSHQVSYLKSICKSSFKGSDAQF